MESFEVNSFEVFYCEEIAIARKISSERVLFNWIYFS